MKTKLQAKVIVVGEQGVGKTSLVVRYIKDEFDDQCMSTIGAAYFTKELIIGNDKVNLHIWDTAGQERFKSMIPMYYRNSSAALLVFDVTQPKTFDAAKVWARELHRNTQEHLILYLVGSKIDQAQQRRLVSAEEASLYAQTLSARYNEVSALTNQGIKELFSSLSHDLLKSHKEECEKNYKTRTRGIQKAQELISEAPTSMQTESCC